MEDHRFPMPMPEPTDDTYGVEPVYVHWSQMPRRADEDATVEGYEVGAEIENAPFSLQAGTWQEIVREAAHRPEPVVLEPAPNPSLRAFRMLREEEDRLEQRRKEADARIGKLSDPQRFTLRRLLFVFTLASAAFAVGAQMPRAVFAGAAGVAALVTAAASRWLVGESAPATLAWWTLMAVYLSAAVFAALRL